MKQNIVFLPGLNCSSKIFGYLHSSLPEHTAFFIDYDSRNSIENSFIDILCTLPEKPFVLIGHSLGGVIGHLISTRTKVPLQKLITISSPFNGSQVAGMLRWFYPHFKIFKDLTPKNSIFREIAAAIPPCPFLSLVSTGGMLPFISELNDGIITVNSQTCIPATRRVTLDSNHFEAVQDPLTISEITKFIFG